MAADGGDTAARSLAHWSEAGRAEMEAFYALARLDYRVLAEALEVPALLRGAAQGRDEVTVLDVACGSGKFPEALLAHGGLREGEGPRVVVDLLDPSAFSVEEAAGVLAPPFAEGARHVTTIEDLDPAVGPFDVVWATHALYAVEPRHLDAAAARMLAARAPHGTLFIANGAAEGHYCAFYEHFLAGLRDGSGTPYRSSQDIAGALRRAGADGLTTRRLAYDHVVAAEEREVLEGYLQRCAFDDTVSLDAMLEAPVLGPYLHGCRRDDGAYVFHQEVDVLALSPEGATT